MKLPVEDDFNDILGKAQKGLGLTTEKLSEMANVSESQIRAARRGEFDARVVEKIGKVMGLNLVALIEIANGRWYPDTDIDMDGFAMVSTAFYDMHVNAFLVWDPMTKEAIMFDTGTEAKPIIDCLEANGLRLKAIMITHTHGDHVACLGEVLAAYPCEVFVNEKEADRPEGAMTIVDGFTYELGALSLKAIETAGHTSGGTTFCVSGLSKPIAIVGDAMFSGSMGGANVSYDSGLKGVQRILELEPGTLIAPGHGPVTTVGQERKMNCFASPTD